VGVKFSAPFQIGPGAHFTSYTVSTGSLPGVKRPEITKNTRPDLALRIREEYSSTSTLPSGLFGLFLGEIYLYLYHSILWSGPGSSVGIVTGYGLDGPGIESVCF
jgi:hypothetical protein